MSQTKGLITQEDFEQRKTAATSGANKIYDICKISLRPIRPSTMLETPCPADDAHQPGCCRASYLPRFLHPGGPWMQKQRMGWTPEVGWPKENLFLAWPSSFLPRVADQELVTSRHEVCLSATCLLITVVSFLEFWLLYPKYRCVNHQDY